WRRAAGLPDPVGHALAALAGLAAPTGTPRAIGTRTARFPLQPPTLRGPGGCHRRGRPTPDRRETGLDRPATGRPGGQARTLRDPAPAERTAPSIFARSGTSGPGGT